MNIQEQHRLEYLKKLDLPNNLFQKLFGNDVTDTIKRYLGEINYFYTQGWPDNPSYFSALSDKTLLPLWECGDCIFAVDLSKDKNEYIQFYLESPEEYEVNGISIYSSLLAVIKSEFDGGATNEELIELIETFQLPEPSELFNLITHGNELNEYKNKICGN